MITRCVIAPFVVFSGLVGLGGCASQPTASMPAPVVVTNYDHVFDAAVEVLRDHRFTVRRMDRRYGQITTYPRTAASAFELWHPDSESPYTGENTFNHQRRTVQVSVQPTDDFTDFELRVEVSLERRQHPERHLNSAAFASGLHFTRGEGVRTIRTEAGYEQSHWRPVGDDAAYAERLAFEILAAARQVHAE